MFCGLVKGPYGAALEEVKWAFHVLKKWFEMNFGDSSCSRRFLLWKIFVSVICMFHSIGPISFSSKKKKKFIYTNTIHTHIIGCN